MNIEPLLYISTGCGIALGFTWFGAKLKHGEGPILHEPKGAEIPDETGDYIEDGDTE